MELTEFVVMLSRLAAGAIAALYGVFSIENIGEAIIMALVLSSIMVVLIMVVPPDDSPYSVAWADYIETRFPATYELKTAATTDFTLIS